jgi:hypothetical protein
VKARSVLSGSQRAEPTVILLDALVRASLGQGAGGPPAVYHRKFTFPPSLSNTRRRAGRI